MDQAHQLLYAYYRYVDDVWGLWTLGEETLRRFHDLANIIHSDNITLFEKQLEFLDVHTSIVNNVVTTDLFSKPTDKHMYLHMCSSHPESTKKAIPYGLGVRIKRICSSNDNYLRHRKDLKSHLQDREYNANFMKDELGKIDSKERTDRKSVV